MGPQERPKKKGKLNMNNSKKIKKMVGIATLAAIVVVLQCIANYITFGPVSITLALIPLVIGAVLYGPAAGFMLGAIMGVVILTAPTTQLFMSFNPFVTFLLCILKTGLAGLIAGFIFKLVGKKHFNLGIILASIVTPIVNTGLFAAGTLLFFMPLFESQISSSGVNAISFVFTTLIGINFLFEFPINVVLSPTICYIIRIVSHSNNYLARSNKEETSSKNSSVSLEYMNKE